VKTQRCFSLILAAVATLPGILASSNALAQFGPPPAWPLVTVRASQPLASEPGNHPGVFTLSRGANTNAATTISFSLGGSATNGVDYLAAPTSVTLAAGQSETNLTITPVAEPAATGYKTVQLELSGDKGREFRSSRGLRHGVVYIAYNYNQCRAYLSPLSVRPTTLLSFPPNIVILAKAGDSNGWVTSVELFAGATSLATVTISRSPPGRSECRRAVVGRAGCPPILRTPQSESFMMSGPMCRPALTR